MHEPIFERLGHELGDAFAHLAHHDRQLPSQPDPQEAPMTDTTAPADGTSLVDKARADYNEAVAAVRSWVAEFEPRAQKIADAAAGDLAKLENNTLARTLVENDLHVPDNMIETAITVLRAFAAAGHDQAAAPAA